MKTFGPEHFDVVNSYNNLGIVYLEKEDYDNALSHYEKALAIRLKTFGPEHFDVVNSYNNLGMVYNAKGDYDNALSHYEKALAIRLKTLGPEHLDVANSYNSLGIVYNAKGDYDNALSHYEKALAIRLKVLGPEHPDVASSYSSLGGIDVLKGNYDKAHEYFENALGILKEAFGPEHSDVAFNYNLLGRIYTVKGDYGKAIGYYEIALEVLLKASNPDYLYMALTYSFIGDNYGEIGKYIDAIKYYERALEITQKAFGQDHPLVATIYNKLGAFYAPKGDYEKAAKYYEIALKTQEKAFGRGHPNLVSVYNNLGSLYSVAFDDCDKAVFYQEKALDIQMKKLGKIHPTVGTTLILLGSAEYHTCKEEEQGIKHIERAFSIWNKTQNYQHIIQMTWVFGKLFMNNRLLALKAVTTGINATERARLDLSSAKTRIMAKALPLYYAGIGLGVRGGKKEKAFEYSEALRSRGFLDQLSMGAALRLEGITERERQRIHRLVSDIEDCRNELEQLNKLNADKRDEDAVAKIGSELAAAEKNLAALDEVLGKRIPKYTQLRNPKPVKLAVAQNWCGPNRAVLEYVLWDPSLEDAIINKDNDNFSIFFQAKIDRSHLTSYCLVVTDDGIEAVPLDGDYDYTEAVIKMREYILKGWDEKLETERNELYEKLISPVLDKIPKRAKEIVIVPDGPLAHLPMDILRKDKESPEFGEMYSISLSPSVSVSVLSAQKARKKTNAALALGVGRYNAGNQRDTRSDNTNDAAYDSLDEAKILNPVQLENKRKQAREEGAGVYFAGRKWNNLPGTTREVRNLRNKVFIQPKTKVLEGKRASEAALKKLSANGKLKGYDVVHLACHGHFDTLVPEMSSVVLSEVSGTLKDDSEDGYLTVSEIAPLNLNAQIVNLSACETGLSEVRRGDGMVGLARSFLVAGTQNVGVTLWSVDDEATREFMTRLYIKVLKKGMSYPDAYSAVKKEFRADAKWSHPYYWAGFVMYE